MLIPLGSPAISVLAFTLPVNVPLPPASCINPALALSAAFYALSAAFCALFADVCAAAAAFPIVISFASRLPILPTAAFRLSIVAYVAETVVALMKSANILFAKVLPDK